MNTQDKSRELGRRERIDVLDHGYVKFVEAYGSDATIIEAARMSTAKGFLGWGPVHKPGCNLEDDDDWNAATRQNYAQKYGAEPKCTCGDPKPGDEKLLRFLYENHHATPFEMAGVIVEVKAPIFVFREWHRHRVPFSYNEMSARYTPLPDENYIPTVERLMMNAGTSNKQAGTIKGALPLTVEQAELFRDALREHYGICELMYQHALSVGVPKELARVHLPVGRYSRMRASSNLRGWLNFLALRSEVNPGAQWEIRQFANALQALLEERFPRTLALFQELGRSP